MYGFVRNFKVYKALLFEFDLTNMGSPLFKDKQNVITIIFEIYTSKTLNFRIIWQFNTRDTVWATMSNWHNHDNETVNKSKKLVTK